MRIFDFSVGYYICRNTKFILTIKGEHYYKGFSIIITKQHVSSSDADINSTTEAQI